MQEISCHPSQLSLFRWACPTSIREFSRCGCVGAWVRGCVGTWVRGRKLLEAELTMTMKIKVINLDENIPKRCFGYLWDPSRT